MCSIQKIRKIALILLLATLISLIPTNTFRVLADSDIVPSFPYDELQTIGENDYVLFKVHGVEQVDYIEVLMPRINAHGNFQHLCPGLSYSSLGGWVLQINSIDYYFKDGQSVYFDLQSLFTTSFMPVENDDNYFPAWLEFVYSTEEIWGIDEDSNQGRGLKWFKDQNFIIPPAATPTPAPSEPTVNYFPTVSNAYYTALTYYTSVKLVMMRFYSESENKYMIRYFTLFSERNRSNQIKSYPVVTSVTDNSGVIRVDFYNQIAGGYPPNYNMYGSEENEIIYFDSLDQILSTNVSLSNHVISLLDPNSLGNNLYYFTYTPTGDYYFEDVIWGSINSDGTVDFDEGGGSPATPTPTTAPTPIPQPSTTPEPEDPDSNSSWGWGIVNALRYIFIPDKNKLIRLEKTTQTKFQQFGGGYDDLKRVSGFEDPVRPQNVVMNWTPFSTDPDDQQQQQQITLVDFEQIDFYLFQTSSGMFIKDCLSASFTFLMFGYLIHVIRKHFVIENTDDDEKGGGD